MVLYIFKHVCIVHLVKIAFIVVYLQIVHGLIFFTNLTSLHIVLHKQLITPRSTTQDRQIFKICTIWICELLLDVFVFHKTGQQDSGTAQ